jgi:hypothetical protein
MSGQQPSHRGRRRTPHVRSAQPMPRACVVPDDESRHTNRRITMPLSRFPMLHTDEHGVVRAIPRHPDHREGNSAWHARNGTHVGRRRTR